MFFPQENTLPALAADPDDAKHRLAEREEEVRRLRQIVCELLHSNQRLRLAMIGGASAAEESP